MHGHSTNIIGSALGACIVVLGAVAVLFLSEWWRNWLNQQQIKGNFLKEIDYLESFLAQTSKSLKRLKEEISVGKVNIYFSYDASNLLTRSINRAYETGLLYAHLSPDELAQLNAVLIEFGSPTFSVGDSVRNDIIRYNKQELGSAEIYQTITWVEDKIALSTDLFRKIRKDFTHKRQEK